MSQPGLRARLITLVTTRIDVAGYGKDALADLYDKRWEVATHLRQLQTPMQMAVLHCKTVLEHRSSIHAACCSGSIRRANTGK